MKRLALALLLVCGVAQADLSTDLVLHYSFEDNLTDSAPGGHNAANYGSGTPFTYETGKVGKCIKFYNSNYAQVDDFAGLDGMGDLTLSVWTKRVDADNWETNSAYNKSIMRVRVEYNTNDGEYTFVVADSDGTEVTLTSTGDAANDANWHNVLITHNGSVLKLYVDGTELDSETPADWSGTLYDGGNPAGIGEAGDLYVDELRIYNRVLTSGEISELVNEGATTPTPTVTNTTANTPTITNTITQTPTITNTPTVTNTITQTPTITNTITDTPTITNTPTITETPTITLTFTPTPTITNTITNTPTLTPTITDTYTATYTQTNTFTVTRTPTITRTSTVTNTRRILWPGLTQPYREEHDPVNIWDGTREAISITLTPTYQHLAPGHSEFE